MKNCVADENKFINKLHTTTCRSILMTLYLSDQSSMRAHLNQHGIFTHPERQQVLVDKTNIIPSSNCKRRFFCFVFLHGSYSYENEKQESLINNFYLIISIMYTVIMYQPCSGIKNMFVYFSNFFKMSTIEFRLDQVKALRIWIILILLPEKKKN